MDRSSCDAQELELGAVADATTAIRSCDEKTAIAPTPSSCIPTAEPFTTLQIKEEIKEELVDDEAVEGEQEVEVISDEHERQGEHIEEQSEREIEEEEEEEEEDDEEEDEEEEEAEEVEEETALVKMTTRTTTAMTNLTHKIPLPWDFSANAELCRSCGKPHTELYELFENEQSERTSCSFNVNNNESNSRKSTSSHDNSNNNECGGADVSSIRQDPRAIARAAIATKTTKQHQQQQEEQPQTQSKSQPSKMDNILQEMQIWQLRIKPNDGLPQRICSKCIAQFYIIGKFRRKCLKVQIRLRAMCEEQPQLFEDMGAKDNLNNREMPVDIGMELIRDNNGQPLSEVELFETNWNATEAANSGTLIEGEMLLDETTISAVGAYDDNRGENENCENDEANDDANDNDDKNDIESTNVMCSDFVSNSVDKQLDSEQCLGTKKKHIDESTSIDKKSLLNSTEPLKTSQSRRKRMRKNTTNNEAEDIDGLSAVSAEAHEFAAHSTDNNDYDPLKEEAMSANKIEIISIENLKNIDLFIAPSTSKAAAVTPQSTNHSNPRHDLVCKRVEEPNMDNKKDCKTTQKELTNEPAKAANIEAIQTLFSRSDGVNVLTYKQKKTAYRIESPTPHATTLATHSNSQNATRAADNTTPTTLMKLNEEGIKSFVSKAALKEYDSSPCSFDEAADDSKSCNVDPQHAPLQTQSTVGTTDSLDSAQHAMEDNPEETLIIPYAQKRRKKFRIKEKSASHTREMMATATAATSKATHGTESESADFRFMHECSVRLCRLSDNKISKLTTTMAAQTTATTMSVLTTQRNNTAQERNENVEMSHNAAELCTELPNQAQTTNPSDPSEECIDDENMPILKKIKLSLKNESFLLKNKGLNWKTKAEMKAVNQDPLSFRKPSLRRQMKLGRYALVSSYAHPQSFIADAQPSAADALLTAADNQVENTNEANAKFTDEEEVASEDLVDNIKVEPLEQPTTTSPNTTEECGIESEEKSSQLKRKLRKSRYHEKLRLKRNLRANLLKLRQHNIAMATDLKRQMESIADGKNESAPAVSSAHNGLTSVVTEPPIEPETPVAGINKVLVPTIDLPPHELFRDALTSPQSSDKSHEVESTTSKSADKTSTSNTPLDMLPQQEASSSATTCDSYSNEENAATSDFIENKMVVLPLMTEENENIEMPVSAVASSSTQADALELAFEPIEREPIHKQKPEQEQDELIVRVPLAVLTEEFQRLHFSCNEALETPIQDEIPCSSNIKPTTAESWFAATENVRQHHQDEYSLTSTQAQSPFVVESTSSSVMQHHHLPTTTDDGNDFANVSKPETTCNLNESGQSEFYGFASESDPHSSYDAGDSFIPEKHSTIISSQINDYINEFQTHCLEADEKSPPSFGHDTELNNVKSPVDLQTLQTTRGCSTHLANNGLDNYVDTTLNGLLDDIQEQNLFSPSTTPLVTMESEDFHQHSSYSPLSSESSDQTQRSQHDYMSNSLCDLSPGPTVIPSHLIDATSQNSYTNAQLQQHQQQHQQLHQHAQQQQQQQQYNNYVECFTEDSTQSELIGFQNDIPCFENIELNSSTPRHSSTPPPSATVAAVLQQEKLPITPARTPDCSVQVGQTHPDTNVRLLQKQAEAGNVHYLGLGSENDLCQSLNTDSMGLVCTTGNGVQMHTPTLKSATGQIQEIPYERETLSSESSENSREYAVDSATLHFTQIFHDMPLQQQSQGAIQNSSQSSSPKLRIPNVATSKKSAILAKYAASNSTVAHNLFPKKIEQNSLQLPTHQTKLQYVTLPPQQPTLTHSTDPNTQLLAASSMNQEMLNLTPAKYTLYTEVLPQDLQWQTTSATSDQQTTTTYYINAADLNQSNLISTTTIAMSPLITAAGSGGGLSLGTGADLNTMTNVTLLPTQLSQPTATLIHHNNDKRSMDANENYMEGMQNQSIMIVFPQDYIGDPTATVSALYNAASGNQLTLAPLQSTYSTIVPPPPPPPPPAPLPLPLPQPQPQPQPQHTTQHIAASTQLNNAAMQPTTIQSNPAATILNSKPIPVSVSSPTISAALASVQHPSRYSTSTLQLSKINLTCRFCHKRPKFTNNLDYSNHIIETHPGENPFNCPYCPMFFTRRAQRLQHIVEAHSADRFNCAQCGQTFCAQRTLDLHLQRAHVPNDPSGQQQKSITQQKPQVTPSSCTQAVEGQQANFEAARTTSWHERSAVQNAQQQAELESLKNTTAPQAVSNADECEDSFDDLANQEPHTHQLSQSTHHQLQHVQGSNTNQCTMPSPEQTEPDSTSTTTLRQFRKQRQLSKSPNEQPERVLRSAHNCVFCEERFTNEVALRKHHQTAHGNQTTLPFVCSMCKRGFRMRTALQRHMETHDSVGRPYECSICLVRFPRPSQLTLHKLTVHFLRKPHACNICGKQFGTESALKTHEKFHGAHIKTHIPLGMCIEEDPPSLQRNREQREREKQQSVASETVERINDATIDDTSSSDTHQAQHSL